MVIHIKIENIKEGQLYTYQELCKLLDVTYSLATNKKVEMLSNLFLEKLHEIDGVKMNGNRENAIPSVMNVQLGVENTAFLYRMDLRGVALSAGSACASASIKPSHVLTAMGLDETQAGQSVRFSFGKENSVEEVLRCAEWTKEIISSLVLGQ